MSAATIYFSSGFQIIHFQFSSKWLKKVLSIDQGFFTFYPAYC
jgi:hypothetical protein